MSVRVASIGECMVELRELTQGQLSRGFGGDTLNTAVYLARLGVAVDYVTALGDDAWSDEMLAAWQAEGIGTGRVQILAGLLPGIYVIQTDPNGERRFLYWRDNSAAKRLFDHLDPAALDVFDVLYLSGITLSIYDEASRNRLFDDPRQGPRAAARAWCSTPISARAAGPIWRWRAASMGGCSHSRTSCSPPSRISACSMVRPARPHCSPTPPPPRSCCGWTARPAASSARAATRSSRPQPVAQVVDTTAAGDSFAAAYLAARLAGAAPDAAARAGHELAGLVVGHPGAIVPRHVMRRPTCIKGALS